MLCFSLKHTQNQECTSSGCQRKTNNFAIAAAIVGGILFIFVLCITVACVRKRKQRQMLKKQQEKNFE